MTSGNRIHVATRKGLFTIERGRSGRYGISATAFLGDPVTMVLHDPRDGALYAALNLGHFGVKMRRSDDGGATWTEIPHPSFAPVDAGSLDATPASPSVFQVWALECAGGSRAGTLWAGTIPAALFHSDDRGAHWTLNEPLWQRPEREKWFGGGYDEAGIHSIAVDPRDAAHLVVAVSCGGVWVSRDTGRTWQCRTRGMFATYMPPERREDPEIQDPHRLVQCPAAPDALWVQHHNGVFRSTDGAESWREVTAMRPSSFGFAVAVHPDDPETAWFVPAVKDECRVPVDGKVVVARTTDGGASVEVFSEGLPQEHAYDLVYRHALDVDAEGRRLVLGSTTGSLFVSEDGGERWQAVSAHLPPIYQVRFA